jgi:hypothetical protein
MRIRLTCFLFLAGCVSPGLKKDAIKSHAERAFAGIEKEEARRSESKKQEVKSVAQEAKPGTTKNGPEFEETGTGTASKYERNIDAQKRAENEALQKASARTGINVYSGMTDVLSQSGERRRQFVSQYLYTWANALISYAIKGAPVFEPLPDGGTRCAVTIKGKIVTNGAPDPSFEIRTDVHGAVKGLSQPVYYEGDEIRLGFTVTKDAFIHVLYSDEDGNVSLLYPNRINGDDNMLKAGETFEIPSGRFAFTLKAVLPGNRDESAELLHIITTKDQPLFSPQDAAESSDGQFTRLSLGDLSRITGRLAREDRSQWTMMVIPYSIRKH